MTGYVEVCDFSMQIDMPTARRGTVGVDRFGEGLTAAHRANDGTQVYTLRRGIGAHGSTHYQPHTGAAVQWQ